METPGEAWQYRQAWWPFILRCQGLNLKSLTQAEHLSPNWVHSFLEWVHPLPLAPPALPELMPPTQRAASVTVQPQGPREHGAISRTRDLKFWSCIPLHGVRVLSDQVLRSSEFLSPKLSPYGLRAPRLPRDGTMLTLANQQALSTWHQCPWLSRRDLQKQIPEPRVRTRLRVIRPAA